MKKMILACAFLVLSTGKSLCVDEAKSDSVTYHQLLERLDNSNYTRIPNRDFDEMIAYKINNSISNKLAFWLTAMAALIAIIGGLVLYTSKKFASEIIREQIDAKLQSIQSELFRNGDLKMEEIREQMEKDLQRINKEIELMNKTSLSTQKFIFGEEFEKTKLLTDKKYYDKSYSKLKSLLKEIEDIGYAEVLPSVVDELIFVCYNLRKYKELNQLIEKYGFTNQWELPSNSYVTAGLVGYNNYYQFGSAAGRNEALRYFEKSLELTPGLGIAQALKLEIMMMDYERASEDEKEGVKVDALKLLSEVNSSIITSSEAMNRLNSDRKTVFIKYVDKLYELFPEELRMMENNANQVNELAEAHGDTGKLAEAMEKYLKNNT